ncbi:MAG: portal protein [Sphaerochaetaceae bacterium]
MTKDDLSTIDQMIKDLENEKQPFLRNWKLIAQYMGLAYGDWSHDPNSHEVQDYQNIDTTAAVASLLLVEGIEGYAFGSTTDFFSLELMAMDEGGDESLAKSALQKIQSAIYRQLADSNFYDESRCLVRSGEDMGTGAMVFSFDAAKSRYRFQTLHLKDLLPIQNRYKEIDSIIRYVYLTRREAADFFGEDKLPQALKDCKKPLERFAFVNLVGPVTDFDFDIKGEGDYISIWLFEKDLEKTLREDRISSKNFAVWRVNIPTYGGSWGVDSPGQISLPTMHFLNLLLEDLITLSELIAKGHWKKTKGLSVDFTAGSVTELESGQDFAYVGASGDLSWLQEHVTHYREVIESNYKNNMFLANELNLKRTKTATEVEGLQNELSLRMSSFYTRLAQEFLQPVIMWMFTQVLLHKQVNLTKEELLQLDKIDLKVSFVSPAFRAQEKAFDLASSTTWMNNVFAIAQVRPDAIDKIDIDKYIDISHRILHAKQELLVKTDDAAKIRSARAEAQAKAMQQAQKQEEAKNLGSLYDQLGKAPEQGSAASALMGGK